MGEVIRLHARKASNKAIRSYDEHRKCEGVFHIFPALPGRCVCGAEWWDGSVPA